ncbi:hypothetical protein [Vibrio sagamiensis]|nr:hypothetical protein [Vibrio sagamiensis]PNQ67395.1 hypothetical protein C1141_08105 [Vibrio agarivorans]
MKKTCILTFLIPLFLSACSNHQASQVGLRSSSVNTYAQKMSNMELCEVLYYKRPSNQSKVSVGAEFNRRGLHKSLCDKEYNKLYVERIIERLIPVEKKAPLRPLIAIQPAN